MHAGYTASISIFTLAAVLAVFARFVREKIRDERIEDMKKRGILK